MIRSSKSATISSQGYTLVELLVSIFIVFTVTGAVFSQINQMQKKSSTEAMKLDMNQAAREFLDQTVRDLHMSGYPSASMYSNSQDLLRVAQGLVSISPTQIVFEGDVNNDGNVYSVKIQYIPNDPADPNCPCIRRWATVKASTDSLNQPSISTTYIETQHVFPPGNGIGQSGEDLFAYYDQNGGPIDASAGIDLTVINPLTNAPRVKDVKTVKINLTLVTPVPDLDTNAFARTSMSATARLNQ